MKTIYRSNYFYGNKISDYGIANGYLDYHTLSKAFDAVLVNDITKLFYGTINGEYSEPEQVNGYIDNSEQIDELNAILEEIEEEQIALINADLETTAAYKELQTRADEINEQIDELEREQDEQREIYQYYIISDNAVHILQEFTNDPVFYLPVLDCYVWGVTHWGTSWDYVLTDVKIELEEDAKQ
jgi:hypothetical protein